jgi:Tol biopolymer transport system component
MSKKPLVKHLLLFSLFSIATGEEPQFLSNIRQLTFEGRRAGEGYFGPSGKLMVLQSEREPDNPFYQIYLMDFETGDVERISPGYGKTTCSWIHPNRQEVLFASTHGDPEARNKQKEELEFRASGKERRYSWDYDETFELYLYDRKSKNYRQLTNATGYDAEGAISPDGNWIVFSSNRLAYSKPLSDVDRRTFETDKAFMMDIYRMRTDGSNLQQLTDSRGYDGGPFFSQDGEKICWRRFSEDGATAEIFTMNSDGRNQTQITEMGAMSWAPFFHPSGEYLIYATNIHGFGNFELYLVSTNGGPPVRVTQTDRFDGLPVFSPDGHTLAWTSQRTAGNQSQIFLGQWNHDAALKILKEGDLETKEKASTINKPFKSAGAPEILAADMRQHVEALASPQFEGRMTGTTGEQKATQYVAEEFRRLGLEPAGENNTYFQPFSFTAGMEIKKTSTLKLDGPRKALRKIRPKINIDWRPVTWSATGETPLKQVVWGNYGIVAPEANGFSEYDSFVHLDVKDKWVMVLRYMPEEISPEHRQHLSRYSSLRYKAMTLRDKGATGMIVISGPQSGVKEQLIPIRFDASASAASLPVISVTDETAELLLCPKRGKDCKSLKKLQETLDDGSVQMGFPTSFQLSTRIDLKKEKRTGRNVLAILKSGLPNNEPPLIVGGHVDHLGKEGGSSSLAREDEKGKIHFGADDNASGVASTLEMAEWLVDQKQQGKLEMKRDILFAAWSGEELGLLGSAHYVDQLAAANHSNDLSSQFAAYLNMDMVGRYGDALIVNGVGSSSVWRREIERRNAPIGLRLALKEDSYLPTDATSFYMKKVPILSVFTGSHSEYHSPRDTPDLLNYEGMEKITKFLSLIARGLAITVEEPDYLEPQKPQEQSARAGLRAYLGTIPDYGEGSVPGLKISGVSKGSPADKAGLTAGDIIVELAGRKIENIYDYTYAIDAVKIGQITSIVVVRDNNKIELEIIPGSRE